MSHLRIVCYSAILIALLSFGRLLHPASEVPYPEGFRNWKHIKTAIIGPKSPAFEHWGGFHHIYANDKAVEGYKSNHFPDGSILVFDVLEAIQKDSDFAEGKRRIIDVMVKDSILFAGTGGWGFEEFKENSKTERLVGNLANTQCFSCHAAKKDNDFVFSKSRD
jgi:hypothetical protein